MRINDVRTYGRWPHEQVGNLLHGFTQFASAARNFDTFGEFSGILRFLKSQFRAQVRRNFEQVGKPAPRSGASPFSTSTGTRKNWNVWKSLGTVWESLGNLWHKPPLEYLKLQIDP
jgi:hypothetical protein